ncbi:MAG: type II secretion system protein [Bdellovibrionales bacterium]
MHATETQIVTKSNLIKNFSSLYTTKGFTLIELMVVMAIIAGMVVLATPYIGNRNTESKAFLRELTVLSRELHTKAKLNGVVYRLVIDLAGPTGERTEKTEQRLWVERSSNRSVLAKAGTDEAAEKDTGDDDDKKKKDPDGFEVDNLIIKEPKSLPRGMRLERVELTRLKNPVSAGKAYIHYLPAGLVDEAAIHIKGQKNQTWTIAIHPLTGKAELISNTRSLKEIRSQ